jgi:hypothetical protein
MHSKIPVYYNFSLIEYQVGLSCSHLRFLPWRELLGRINLQHLKYCSAMRCLLHPSMLSYVYSYASHSFLSPPKISHAYSNMWLFIVLHLPNGTLPKILIESFWKLYRGPDTLDLIQPHFFFASHNCQGLALSGDRWRSLLWTILDEATLWRRLTSTAALPHHSLFVFFLLCPPYPASPFTFIPVLGVGCSLFLYSLVSIFFSGISLYGSINHDAYE